MVNIVPPFLLMLMFVSIVLYLLPDTAIIRYLGHRSTFSGMMFAALVGSFTIMPGFIAFPLCGILLQHEVTYMVLSSFTTTLMMVGILTYPLEQAYLGHKVTILRNLISFGIAMIVAIITGLFFGELWL